MGWDRHLEDWIVAQRWAPLDRPIELLTYAGTEGALWLVVGAALAWPRRDTRLFATVVAADLAADLSTRVLQVIVGRERPNEPLLVGHPHSHSFPSGHAATSFACATVLSSFAPRLRAPLFGLATLVALSRLYVGVHYPTDVAAGAAWGGAVGLAVVRGPRLRGLRRRGAGHPQ